MDYAEETERYSTALRLGAVLVHGARGLKKFPWYEARHARVAQMFGYQQMVQDAAGEIMLHMQDGADEMLATTMAAKRLAAEWRAEFEKPTMVALDHVEVTVESAEDTALRNMAAAPDRVTVAKVMITLTEREREILWAAAYCGSQAEAARLLGVSRQTVWQAVNKARRAVTDTNVRRGEGSTEPLQNGSDMRVQPGEASPATAATRGDRRRQI